MKSAIFQSFHLHRTVAWFVARFVMLNIVRGEILLWNTPHQSLPPAKVKISNEETGSHERGYCRCCRLAPTSAVTQPWQGFKFSCRLWQHRQKTGWMSSCNVTVDCWCVRKDTDSLILDHSAWFVAWRRCSQALALFYVRLTASHLHASCDTSSQLMRLFQSWENSDRSVQVSFTCIASTDILKLIIRLGRNNKRAFWGFFYINLYFLYISLKMLKHTIITQ